MECGIKEELALQASEDVNYSRNCFRRNSGLGEIIILVTIVDKKKNNTSFNKTINPKGPYGLPLRCLSRDSVRHLVKQCPHSYENMAKQTFENAVLFTGNMTQEIIVLLTEAANSAGTK